MLDPADTGLDPVTRRPEIPGRPQSVAEVLDPTLRGGAERLALVARHGRYTYGELDREANRAAHALRALGVGPGERVAACLPNDSAIVVAFLACMRLGAIWVGVNRPLAPREKVHILNDSGARCLLATPEVLGELAGAELSALAQRVCVAPGDAADEWSERLAREAARENERPECALDPWGPAAIAYTSGTTGLPKGAVHSQHNILLPGAVTAASGTYPPDVAQGAVLPLTILNIFVLGPVQAWQNGSPSVAMDRIDARGVADWVEAEGIGHFAGVPTLLHDLLTHPEVRPEQLRALTQPLVGGAECPEEFRALYRERFGHEVSIGYGMTEAPTSVTRAWEASNAPGLCGKALPQVEVSIRDAEGRVLPPGEEGEICVGPARSGAWAGVYTPMLGYWKRPDASAAALADGVYHSGDVGVLEPDGTLFIRGRRNELILRGGANVYPAEVERVLLEHAAVAEAAVFGLPDHRLGERVVAAVRLETQAGGEPITAEALQEHCREGLARYKVPERIAFVSSMPRNAMSKIVKRDLHACFEEEVVP